MAEQTQQLQGEEYSDEQLRASLERAIIVQVVLAIDKNREKNRIPAMASHGYPKEIIDKFANDAVEFADDFSPEKAAEIRKMYSDIVSSLPQWQQALVLESGRPVVFGNYETINKLYAEGEDVATGKVDGFYRRDENKVFVSVDCKNVANTTYHEKGHQFDWGQGKFYSNTSSWQDALAREKEKGWHGESALAEVAPERTISQHLNLDYEVKILAFEAMAEMTAIYNQVYVKYGGDIAKTDALMARAYPELFPVYQKEFIPHAIAKALDTSTNMNLTKEKLSNPENILVSDGAERNISKAEIKEIDLENSDGKKVTKKGFELVGNTNERSIEEVEIILKAQGINVSFTNVYKPEHKSYFVFDDIADSQKFEELRVSGNLLKHIPLAVPNKFVVSAKSLATFLPTNLDNLLIAEGVGLISAGVTYWNGGTHWQAGQAYSENYKEVSGFSSFGRSIDAGSDGKIIESAKQLLDGLGMPIPALEEAIKKSWQECSPRDFKAHCLPASQKPKTNER